MKTLQEYDIAIIGAGIIGSALGWRAKELFPYCSVAVFEKNAEPGLETSAKNSGVLHSGFHQKPDSLKAQFARYGHALAHDFAVENNVPLLEGGMLIAVPSSEMRNPRVLREGAASMWNLFSRGREHGIDFTVLTSRGIKKLEPNIRAAAGVFIPSVSVVDSKCFVRTLEKRARMEGTRFFYENKIEDIRLEKNYAVIVTPHMEVRAKAVINAAGLYADDIANLALKEERYRQYPWRGEYYEVINPEKKNLVSRLVYPVVSHDHPGKGIHFGPRPDGRLFLGPNAKRVPSKTFYDEGRTPKDEFLKVPNAFGIGLTSDDIEWSYSGIRPKRFDAEQEGDFHIGIDSVHPLLINCMWVESPGFSSGMALAKYVMARPEVFNALR
jgi:glycerol-3-phosphate dehydrogenase